MSSLGFNLGLGKIFWGAIKERGVEIHWAVQKAINLFFTTLQHKYAKLEKKNHYLGAINCNVHTCNVIYLT